MYVQSDTLLLADVFENFWNMGLEIYELDPAKFPSAPGLAWQAPFKKAEVNLDLLTHIDMLLMVKKGTREGICHSIYWYTKANNKYLKGYDKNKELSYIQKVSNLYGWTMLQKLPVKHFPSIKVTSQFNEDFIKIYIEERNKEYFLEVAVQFLEKLHQLQNEFPFLPERIKIKKVDKFVANLHDKTEYAMHMMDSKQVLNHELFF